jgi:hypothetical protein
MVEAKKISRGELIKQGGLTLSVLANAKKRWWQFYQTSK